MSQLSHFRNLIVLTSNFYVYTALIYILCYNSGIAGQGEVQGPEPPSELSKVLFESCISDENFFWGGWMWGYFQSSHPLLSCNWHSLSILSSTSGGFAARPQPGLCPWTQLGDFHLQTPWTFKPAYSAVLLYYTRRRRVPTELNVRCSIVVPSQDQILAVPLIDSKYYVIFGYSGTGVRKLT